jgi:SAM-dependent methyltransferase
VASAPQRRQITSLFALHLDSPTLQVEDPPALVTVDEEVRVTDSENVQFARSGHAVDALNAEFYGRFPYPWPSMKVRALDDPHFERIMLCQNVGDWEHRILPEHPRIWVAGCGTNQAVMVALRFPRAQVVASDVSAESLRICGHSARQLNVHNLELRHQSLNSVSYESEFDFIVSTGVIHHNASPGAVLRNIVRALKPHGLLELMVYNRAHWTLPANFQRAVRLLCGHEDAPHFASELEVAKAIVAECSMKNSLDNYLTQFKDCPEAMFADALLQPVLHSYTIESFDAMARECDLEMLQPHVSGFDRSAGTLTWNMRFSTSLIQNRYDSLPDLQRWKISNLLLWESSPSLLWFYFQRTDAGRPRKSETEICDEFLRRRFASAATPAKCFLRRKNGYVASPRGEVHPSFQADASVQAILRAVDPRKTMADTMTRCGFPLDLDSVNRARIALTTSEFPFLRCVG